MASPFRTRAANSLLRYVSIIDPRADAYDRWFHWAHEMDKEAGCDLELAVLDLNFAWGIVEAALESLRQFGVHESGLIARRALRHQLILEALTHSTGIEQGFAMTLAKVIAGASRRPVARETVIFELLNVLPSETQPPASLQGDGVDRSIEISEATARLVMGGVGPGTKRKASSL